MSDRGTRKSLGIQTRVELTNSGYGYRDFEVTDHVENQRRLHWNMYVDLLSMEPPSSTM